jgi:hypothetical protein
MSTSYNIAADSMNWQPISFNARTKIFRKLDIVYNSAYDIYSLDKIKGIKIDKLEVNTSGRLLRMVGTSLALNTVIASSESTKSSNNRKDAMKKGNENPDDYADFNIPWSISANYNYTVTSNGGSMSYQILNLVGRFNITPKWRIELNSGYDLKARNFSFSTVDIFRDLHCWEMRFNWIPFGFRKSFNFTLNVKSSVLQDLKLVRRRQWFDLQ